MSVARLLVPLLLLAGCGPSGGQTASTPSGGAACAVSPVASAPAEPASPGAKALREYCSACHAAPPARRHTAGEWPQVVARMELHRVQRGMGEIPEEARAQLIAFLKQGAKK